MTVIHVKSGNTPIVLDVENELKALQKLVGGYIETVSLPGDIILVVNEEGYLKGLPESLWIKDLRQKSPIFGNCFFAGKTSYNFVSLTPKQIRTIEGSVRYNPITGISVLNLNNEWK